MTRSEPWFVLTGDTLFVGAVGRPDLPGHAREIAAQLYASLHVRHENPVPAGRPHQEEWHRNGDGPARDEQHRHRNGLSDAARGDWRRGASRAWRASSVGVYRLWRDLGFAVGALLAGITADVVGIAGAMWLVAAITFASGVVAALRMRETLHYATT